MKIHKACQIEKCTSNNPDRWILQQVQLREINGEPVAVASNGWGLAVVPVAARKSEYGLVESGALRAARKKVRKNDTSVELGCGPDMLHCPIGDYPDITKVLPDESDGYKNVIAIDAKALLAIQESMGAGAVILCLKDELSAVIVKPASNKTGIPEPKAFGVLMPCRMS